MITESIAVKGLYVISLAQTPIYGGYEWWKATKDSYDTELWFFTVFAVVALIISVILLFWVFAKHEHYEQSLNLKITELIITNEKLGETAELNRERVEALENIIDGEQSRKEIPTLSSREFKPLVS